MPNGLSAIRLALIPVFLYLLLVRHADGWAVAILMFSGASDWADGKIARLMNQSSRLGEYLDPLVDRLFMVTTPIAFGLRHIVPWWIIAILLVRDVLLAAELPLLRTRGITALPVIYVGKAATFALMSVSTTWAPASAKAFAVASPMPEAAPVTTTVLPLKFIYGSLQSGGNRLGSIEEGVHEPLRLFRAHDVFWLFDLACVAVHGGIEPRCDTVL